MGAIGLHLLKGISAVILVLILIVTNCSSSFSGQRVIQSLRVTHSIDLQSGITIFSFTPHSGLRFPLTHYDDSASLEGDLILERNDTFAIRDCFYKQNGNIIVRDNATLIIENATVSVNNSIILTGNTKFYADHANIFPIGESYVYICFYNESKGKLTNVRIGSGEWLISPSIKHLYGSEVFRYMNSFIQVYDHSLVLIINSQFNYLDCYNSTSVILRNSNITTDIKIEGYSTVTIENIEAEGVRCSGHSIVNIVNSTWTEYLGALDNSKVNVINSRGVYRGKVLSCNNSFINLTETICGELSLRSVFAVYVEKCDVKSLNLRVGDMSNLTLVGMKPTQIGYWNSHVNGSAKANLNLTLLDSNISEWEILVRETATLRIIDSTVKLDCGGHSTVYVMRARDCDIYARETSTMNLTNSTLNLLDCNDYSEVYLQSVTINFAHMKDTSTMTAIDSTISYLRCSGSSIAYLKNVRSNRLQGEGSSRMYLENVMYGSIFLGGRAEFYEILSFERNILPLIFLIAIGSFLTFLIRSHPYRKEIILLFIALILVVGINCLFGSSEYQLGYSTLFFSLILIFCFTGVLGLSYFTNKFYLDRNPWIRDIKNVKAWTIKGLWFNPIYFSWLLNHDPRRWAKYAILNGFVITVVLGILIGILWFNYMTLHMVIRGLRWASSLIFWAGFIFGVIVLTVICFVMYFLYVKNVRIRF